MGSLRAAVKVAQRVQAINTVRRDPDPVLVPSRVGCLRTDGSLTWQRQEMAKIYTAAIHFRIRISGFDSQGVDYFLDFSPRLSGRSELVDSNLPSITKIDVLRKVTTQTQGSRGMRSTC